MKATDLMIGDWFVTKKAKEMPMRIISIDKFIYGRTTDGMKIGPFFAEEVVPIPLTPEILEKNGFTRYGQVYANLQQWVGKFGDKRKSLVQDIRTGEWGMNDVWIDYVHELQHVLKLCRIENEIVL